MQARQIDLKSYTVRLISGNEVQAGYIVPVYATVEVHAVEWMDQHLLATAVGHNPAEYIAAADIMGKFRGAKAEGEDHLLLDLADWDKVNQILNKLRGYGKQDDQMLRRVREAPLIDLEARMKRLAAEAQKEE